MARLVMYVLLLAAGLGATAALAEDPKSIGAFSSREIRRGSSVPSAHTYDVSIHGDNRSRVKGSPAAATILTG
jgi:hypothetical protein